MRQDSRMGRDGRDNVLECVRLAAALACRTGAGDCVGKARSVAPQSGSSAARRDPTPRRLAPAITRRPRSMSA